MGIQPSDNPELVLTVGNIGSGKSTFISKFIKEDFTHIVVSKDAIRYMIGGGNYIYDEELEPMVWNIEKEILEKFLNKRYNIILDGNFISKKLRSKYIKLAKYYKYRVVALEFTLSSNKDVCVERRLQNPHGQPSVELWSSVWNKFNKNYDKLTLEEGLDKIILL